MVTEPAKSIHDFHFTWGGLAVCLLMTMGVTAFFGFLIAHWTERQILTTDNWVATVSPIPKDDAVATALSTYTVDTVFTAADLQSRISQALPDKASFLAPTLTDQLQTRLTNRTKQAIQSDAFQTIWQRLNQAASQRLLARARGTAPERSTVASSFNLDLGPIKNIVTGLLAPNPPNDDTAAPQASDKVVDLKVNLKTSAEKLASYIKIIDFLNAVLGLAALVFFLGALVLSRNRRRLLIIISLSIITVSLLQLIGVKSLQPAVLNAVSNSAYRPAVSVVYDSLLATFRRTATVAALIGLLLFVISYFSAPRFVGRSKVLTKELKSLKKSGFWQSLQTARQWLRQYLLQITIGLVLVGLAVMAFAPGLDNQGILRGCLFTILFIELANLVAATPKGAPM